MATEREGRLEEALKLVLMFHKGGPWTDDDSRKWRVTTGIDEATTRVLCNHLRNVLSEGK